MKDITPLAVPSSSFVLPPVIAQAGEETSRRFVEFFLVSIRNENTRTAYAQAVRQFLDWCEERSITFSAITSITIAAYVESHSRSFSAPTVNQHLAAIRSLFQWLVDGKILDRNPAAEVRGIKHRVKTGKTPVLSDEEMKQLLEGIDVSHVVGLRDRALIATMFYSFARIGAVVGMSVGDYFTKGRRTWIRLHEKGGKYHEVPVHHTAEAYLDEYINAAEIADEKKAPLFRTTIGRSRKLTERRLERREAWAMVKRRAEDTGVNTDACNHTFRASGITNYLRNGGSRDNAQKIAAHSDVRTTALYDRRDESISLDEIERIRL
ncbi:tyrosine-type recombinase/integrase [Leptolyngbya sp. GGD]|uniref:tyrosine-type recombinase/integrase n=1 Tax=Leptolyngbya sp. GGD TaxID=2997907 RepID=UPI00227CCC8D|nr:tyrosine-type recombinase/integrase [Leptolyngbya sp. GGD]MCY6494536.1 tyrosine-type recombinase/integrase [Leptolyngbya sp. GGD]